MVLVSGSGSNLQALLDASAVGSLPADIVAVVANRPDVFALERAAVAGVDAAVLEHATDVERSELPDVLAELSAYPNPVRTGNHFTLDASRTGTYVLVDVLGRQVRTLDLSSGRNVVDTAGLASGMYFIRSTEQPAKRGASLVVTR